MAAALRLDPDVVLMDVLMPGMDGAQATAAIRSRRPAMPAGLTAQLLEEYPPTAPTPPRS